MAFPPSDLDSGADAMTETMTETMADDTIEPSPPNAETDPAGVAESTRAKAWRHGVATLKLALPVMLARSGTLVMISTDVIMTGRAGAVVLAHYGLGLGLSHNLFVIGLGAMNGTTVLTAQAVGLGRHEQAGTIWRVGMAYALVMGLIFVALSGMAEGLLRLTGQEASLAEGGGTVVWMFALGLPPMLMYLTTAMFLEAIGRTLPNLMLMVGAILLNIVLNRLFIFEGELLFFGFFGGGLELDGLGMGAAGAALATSLVRWAMFIALAGFVLLAVDNHRYGIRGPLRYAVDIGRKLRQLGLPLGVAHGLETGAFTTVVLMAGVLGAVPMAVYQMTNNLFSVIYMSAIGLGTATSVRVGLGVGAGRMSEVRWAGWTGLTLGLMILAVACAAFNAWPGSLASLYTSDSAALALGLLVLPVAGWFLMPDGGQGILVGALRGTGDIWIPSAMVTAGFWGVTVPLGYWLAFRQGMGIAGLMWGLILGALLAAVLLVFRFYYRTRRPITPV